MARKWLSAFFALALAGCGGSGIHPEVIGAGPGDTVGSPSINGGAGSPSIGGGAGAPSTGNGGAASGPIVLSGPTGGDNGGGNGGGSGSGGSLCAIGTGATAAVCACASDANDLGGAVGSSMYTTVANCNSSAYPCCCSINANVCVCENPPAQLTCAQLCDTVSQSAPLASCP